MLPERLLAGSVVLRRFVVTDAPRVELLAGDYRVAETTALIPHPYPEGAAHAWIATHESAATAAKEYVYAIIEPEGFLVGAISLRADPGEREHIGYWIGRPYWGRGYASAAAEALIAIGFGLVELPSITASHLTRNAASGRVLEKCGMMPLRTARREHRGAVAEFRIRGITREAWEKRMAE